MRRSLPLIATLAAEAGAVLVLYRFIKEPGLAIPIAFGCAAWLLGTTVLYLAARLAQVPAAVNAVGRVTLPALRHRVDRAVAASILTGALVATGAPAFAAADPAPSPVATVSVAAAEPAPSPEAPSVPSEPETPVDTEVPIDESTTTSTLAVRSGRAGDPAAIVAATTTPERAFAQAPKPRATAVTPQATAAKKASRAAEEPRKSSPPAVAPTVAAPLPAVAPTTEAAASYTVVRGDSFWEIATRHLAQSTGRDRAALTTSEITEYWGRLCDANRDHIQSGDVNLIYAGEVVELPAV